MRPKAKSNPGVNAPVPRRCPKASPMVGMKPGKVIEYWLRYDIPTLRTIIKARATHCAVLYHFLLSSGSFGVIVSFARIAESVRLKILTWLSPTFFHFIFKAFPCSSLAEKISRFVFLPCDTTIEVSALRVISCSKLFLFLGSAFFFSSSFSFAFCSFAFFFCSAVIVGREGFLGCVRLNRSFVFFRKGTWL